MANDRLFLRCTSCKERLILGKYYPGVFTSNLSSQSLEEFLNDHLVACLGTPRDFDDGIGLELCGEKEAYAAADGRQVLRLTSAELSALGEYSCTLPTGTTIGKRWKRNIHPTCNGAGGAPPEQTQWIIGEYYDIGDPDRVGIHWYDVEVVDD